jgi:hypothetical protein
MGWPLDTTLYYIHLDYDLSNHHHCPHHRDSVKIRGIEKDNRRKMPQEACVQIKEELVQCVIRSDWYVMFSARYSHLTPHKLSAYLLLRYNAAYIIRADPVC